MKDVFLVSEHEHGALPSRAEGGILPPSSPGGAMSILIASRETRTRDESTGWQWLIRIRWTTTVWSISGP